jgi:hypothetical protein
LRGYLPLPQKCRWASTAQRQDGCMHNDQTDRGGQADRLSQSRFRGATLVGCRQTTRGLVPWENNRSAGWSRAGGCPPIRLLLLRGAVGPRLVSAAVRPLRPRRMQMPTPALTRW